MLIDIFSGHCMSLGEGINLGPTEMRTYVKFTPQVYYKGVHNPIPG